MNTVFKKYIDKYGQFSHILNVIIDENLPEEEKLQISETIYDIINEKRIIKRINNREIHLMWRLFPLASSSEIIQYYTDGNGILEDIGVWEHTKLVLNDIRTVIDKDKFSFMLTKPLTVKHCMM